MLTTVYSASLSGLEGFTVTVECFSDRGLPSIEIIGLPDAAIKEAIERIHAVTSNNSLPFIKGRTTVNLAPADRKKSGSGFDLAIIVAIVAQSVMPSAELSDACFIGELSLTGDVRPCKGVLPMCLAAKADGKRRVFIPAENAAEGAVVDGIDVYGVKNIIQLIAHLNGAEQIEKAVFEKESAFGFVAPAIDFADIKGQETAKRAIEIAAAGAHNVLLIGPPGSGKSMISKAIPGILPQMSFSEMIETTKIHSVSGILPPNESLVRVRPFRAPHHTMSFAGLAGGGAVPMPGEISLCHNGVLFLDELPEFDKRALEVLRQPLEDRVITITRAAGKITFPASFMVVCAMNPCPCGYYGSEKRKCTCTKAAVEKYLSKISGPLLDRIDIQIEVPAVSFDEITAPVSSESSFEIRKRVEKAREIAAERYKEIGVFANGLLGPSHAKKYCNYSEAAKNVLETAFERLNLSARGYDRILRVSRTIADLEGEDMIGSDHVLEAVQLRSLDRKYF
ncbi:MAG: YifB family Mg chelatase-like AAA ATPase [Oscillospiraceae bacterium]|nr:YifB family Mg chelatase-like AAA ATPase [Oscillospiraceae bacterium]